MMASMSTRMMRLSRSTMSPLAYLACRSIQSDATALRPLLVSNLERHLTENPRPLTPKEELIFGHTFSDHMLLAEWTAETGWGNPRLQPYGKISLEPSAAVFHYAFEVG
jgi:hypothetical protein